MFQIFVNRNAKDKSFLDLLVSEIEWGKSDVISWQNNVGKAVWLLKTKHTASVDYPQLKKQELIIKLYLFLIIIIFILSTYDHIRFIKSPATIY